MSYYTLAFLKHVDLTDTAYEEMKAQFPTATLDKQVRVTVRVGVNANSLRDAMIEANRHDGVGRYAHYVRSKSSGWYTLDVIQALDRALVSQAHGGPFTAEEQLNADAIPTNVPAGSTPQVISAARKRYNRLRRLLIIREFCVANPGLSFDRPDGRTYGVTVLRLAGCGKTRFEGDAVPRNSLVSTAQPDKKKACEETTSSSWMCSAT